MTIYYITCKCGNEYKSTNLSTATCPECGKMLREPLKWPLGRDIDDPKYDPKEDS